MRFLTLGFYILFGALLAWFAVRNWDVVTLRLFGDYELAIRLPLLILLVFLAGTVPLALLQNFSRWRLRRRIRYLERALEDAQPATTTQTSDVPSPRDSNLPPA